MLNVLRVLWAQRQGGRPTAVEARTASRALSRFRCLRRWRAGGPAVGRQTRSIICGLFCSYHWLKDDLGPIVDFGAIPHSSPVEVGRSCVYAESSVEHDGLDSTLLAEQRGTAHAARGRVKEWLGESVPRLGVRRSRGSAALAPGPRGKGRAQLHASTAAPSALTCGATGARASARFGSRPAFFALKAPNRSSSCSSIRDRLISFSAFCSRR